MELFQRLRRIASKKLIDLCRDQITNMAEGSQSLLLAPGDLAWINKPPMDLVACIGKEWAGFSRLITDGNDQIHWSHCRKFLNTLGSTAAEVNPDLLHDLDCQWMHRSRLHTCTKDFIGISPT